MTVPDYSRLPKYARERIATLESENERLREKVRLLESGPDLKDSNTFADPYLDGLRPIGRDVMVRFGSQEAVDDCFDVNLCENGDLYVLVNGRMAGDVAVIPQSSNTIRIRKLLPRRAGG